MEFGDGTAEGDDGRIQSVNPLLGDEIVFCASLAGTEPVPIVIAWVQPGRRAELRAPWKGVRRGRRGFRVVFRFRRLDGRFKLALATGVGPRSPGAGRGSPFGAAIAERTQRVGWLIAMDAPPLVTKASGDDALRLSSPA